MSTGTAEQTHDQAPEETASAPPPPESTLRSRIALLLPFARDDAGRYLLSAVLATLGTLSQLGPFYVIYLAIRDILDGSVSGSRMYGLALAALAFVVSQYVLMALAMLVSHRAAFGTLYRLRIQSGDRLGRVPLGRVTGKRSGEIQRTISEDVERLESFLGHAIPDLVSAVVVVLATTTWLFLVDWRMALAAVACLIVAVILMGRAMTSSQALMGGYAASMARMNGSIVEMVRGLPVVRMFNRTGDTFTETKDAIEAAAKYQADWGRAFLPLYTAFFTLTSATIVTIVPVGLVLWTNDAIGTAELLFFFVIGLGYGAPVVKLLDFGANMSHLTYGAELVNELKDADVLPEADQPAELSDTSVEFEDVSFRHAGAGRPTLDRVSFRAEPRTITALVGPSGAGKTTVGQLICRFFDVDEGAVRVGGADLRDIPSSQLMEHVSFVFQDTFLFDDTVEANLRLAKADATEAELVTACRSARAHEFISALPDGYRTRIGAQGARLSGGQRQRLAIARTLLKHTDIVVLDEATAFVDPENEVALQEAINALISDRTVIMIAHRLSTIAGADQILVVDEGRIVECGQHGDLVSRGGLYTRMWAAFQSIEDIALGDAVRANAASPDSGTATPSEELT
ncbi:ABC transporter ATP-binding protein [Phytoactinopolyspora mesophila]|uniref:ATP-binding cassette domain-containing protein n=1 Tax=Phytoactinopolyspora mesophila TaxID=2650750 RepID=A0A7K3M643_9ACTN|nr:ABC transporter ATP-binding protein [Phytoactinopolyspora mesophila]NDL58726.1 ATP-binding cassette domain-containing protein [Phytoactinopolyspora mesophila]